MVYFYKAIEKVHSGKDTLARDYTNFKPNTTFGQTKLIVRIADKLYKYYKEDKAVQKKLSKFYQLAFLQFENSYNNTKYNKTYDELLRRIINGVLTMKQKYGYINFEIPDLLNRTETIQNQLAWLNFYQNRYADNLPELEVFQFKKLNIRKQLVNAKRENDLVTIDSLSLILKSTEENLSQQFPNLELLKAKKFQVEDLQKQLVSDQIVLKYLILNEQIAIFKISKDQLKVELVPWLNSEKEKTTNYIESLKSKTHNQKQAEELADVLLPEMDSKTSQIFINPDAELYPLAFETLFQNNQFLAERFKISYTSSLAFIFPGINSNSLNKSEELAIYLPQYAEASNGSDIRSGLSILKGAKEEAEELAKLFSTSIYTSDKLTKEDFINTSKNAKLIHLAMHAEVNNTEPGLSRLLFNNSKNENNHLYLEEIYGMNLAADLAVLSACNTGFGKETAKKSMASFQRAFTFAGVPATVASLWEVPDNSTKEIMKTFYTHLSKGLSKSESLQRAKQDYLNNHTNTKLAEPYYWAGFVLYGLDKPVVTQRYFIKWHFLLIAIIISLIFIYFYNKNPRLRA